MIAAADADAGLSVLGLPKNNYTATAAPTVNDDSGDGYSAGSQWYDQTNDNMYHCLDATLGAAVWVQGDIVAADLGAAALFGTISSDTFSGATTSNVNAASNTKTYIDNQVASLPLRNSFESSEQSISDGGLITVAHSLTGLPKFVQVVLVCKTADLGFSVDDELYISDTQDATNYGVSVAADGTNIEVQVGSNGIRIAKQSATAGDTNDITNGNWRIVVRAWN